MSENRWSDVDGRLLDEVRALDGRELDVAVEYEVMGWSEMDRKEPDLPMFQRNQASAAYRYAGRYSTDPAAATRMERRIVSMGLGDRYGCYLAWAVLGPRSDQPATLSCLELAAVATASTSVRCRAALAAVRGSGTD